MTYFLVDKRFNGCCSELLCDRKQIACKFSLCSLIKSPTIRRQPNRNILDILLVELSSYSAVDFTSFEKFITPLFPQDFIEMFMVWDCQNIRFTKPTKWWFIFSFDNSYSEYTNINVSRASDKTSMLMSERIL